MEEAYHGGPDTRREGPYPVNLALSSFRLERVDACAQVEIELHLAILDENSGIARLCKKKTLRQNANISPSRQEVTYLAEGHRGSWIPGLTYNLVKDAKVTRLALKAKRRSRRDSISCNCRSNVLDP